MSFHRAAVLAEMDFDERVALFALFARRRRVVVLSPAAVAAVRRAASPPPQPKEANCVSEDR